MTKVSPPPRNFDAGNNAWQNWFQEIRNRIEKPLLEGDTRIAGNILKIGKNFFTADFEQFGNSAYLVLDKLTEEDDASLVFRQKGAVVWEMGAVTELPGDESNFHLKRVTGVANKEVFTDVLIWDHATGDGRVIAGFKFGIGTVPVENFHYAKDADSARAVAKFENSNTDGSSSSESAALQFAGNSFSFVIGNDFGLNGGDNFFVQSTTGGIKIFADTNGVAINGSTLAATEAFRVDSTTGGILPPRMTTTQRNALGTKTAGLFIFNTTDTEWQGWNGSTWVSFV